MSLKQNRIIKIVMEFVKAEDTYDITGIDLGLAKFFYRESQMLFQDLATGDYTISTGGGKQILTITNPELLAKIEAFQVAYVLDFDASKYDTQWNVDINTLKDKYNQLLDVTFNVWEYVRKIGFVADDTDMQIILPQLNTGEVWVKTDTGWRGLNVGDIESNINAFWVEFNKKTQEILEQIVTAGKVQEGLLEDFTQQKIKEINEEGLKLEVTQVGHGFIFNAVQFDKTTGAYTKADVNTGADGIAVRIDDDKFYLSSNGIIEIPANAADSKGNPYELDEYYFLDNEVAGGCTPEKPIYIFQALFCVVNKKGVKSALVEIGDPIDLNPRILVDEINSLGLATTDQVVLSEPTIADLIASKKYKVGDVVQVLGYYAKGDGAGHKRKIEATDDGSGIRLSSGLWANVIDKLDFQKQIIKKDLPFVLFEDTEFPKNLDVKINCSNLNIIPFVYKIKTYYGNSDDFLLTVKENGDVYIKNTGETVTIKKAMPNYIKSFKKEDRVIATGHTNSFGDFGAVGSFTSNTSDYESKTQVTRYSSLQHAGNYGSVDSVTLFAQNNGGEFPNVRKVYGTYSNYTITLESDFVAEPGDILLAKNSSGEWIKTIVKNVGNGIINTFDWYVRNGGSSTTSPSPERQQYWINPIHRLWGLNVNCGLPEKSDVHAFSVVELGAYNNDVVSIANVPDNKILDIVNLGLNKINYGAMIRGGTGTFDTGILIDKCKDGIDLSDVLRTGIKLRAKEGSAVTLIDTPRFKINQDGNMNTTSIIPARISGTVSTSASYIDIDTANSNINIGTGYFGQIKFIINRGGSTATLNINGTQVASLAHNTFTIVCYLSDTIVRVFSVSQAPSTLTTLDTPYHAAQMSSLGILDSYYDYLTELHEYEKSQNTQSDTDIMNLNVLQPPVIPTEVEAYAKEYNLI